MRCKQLFICFLLILCGHRSDAAHLIGGAISYNCLGYDSIFNESVYDVYVDLYRDGNSQNGAQFDIELQLGIFRLMPDGSWSLFDERYVSNYLVQNIDITSPLFSGDDDKRVEQGSYVTSIILPGNEVYQIVYQRCCLANNIQNIYNDSENGMAINAIIKTSGIEGCNSSPRSNNNFINQLIVGSENLIDFSFTDPDGDDFIVKFDAPLTSGGIDGAQNTLPATSCTGVTPSPSQCAPPFGDVQYIMPQYSGVEPFGQDSDLIFSKAGILTGTVDNVGTFYMGMTVEEYRDGEVIGETRFYMTVDVIISAYYARVQGKRFWDVNENEIYDNDEPLVSNFSIKVRPVSSKIEFPTASDYYFLATTGVYRITSEQEGWEINKPNNKIDINVALPEIMYEYDVPFVPSDDQPRLDVELISPINVCSLTNTITVIVKNNGAISLGGIIHFELDESSEYLDSDFTPESIVGNTISWNVEPIEALQQATYKIEIMGPLEEQVGTPFMHQLTAVMNSGQNVTVTEEYVYEDVYLCSDNPNNKQVVPARGGDNLTLKSEELNYLISFQNTLAATVEDIRIVDKLEEGLDFEKLIVTASSHDYKYNTDGGGVVSFLFENINLIDSISDPINSKGFIAFSVPIKNDTANGTRINNRANIYFDSNAPIITNTTLNTVSTSTAVKVEPVIYYTVYPNPSAGRWTIDIPRNTNQYSIDVINCNGQLIYSESLENSTIIDGTNWNSAIYFYRIKDIKGQIVSYGKLLKM